MPEQKFEWVRLSGGCLWMHTPLDLCQVYVNTRTERPIAIIEQRRYNNDYAWMKQECDDVESAILLCEQMYVNLLLREIGPVKEDLLLRLTPQMEMQLDAASAQV